MITNKPSLAQTYSIAIATMAILLLSACSKKPNERTYQLKPQPAPIEKVVILLEGYREGKKVGSEVTGLPALMVDMEERSGDKVEIVQEAFDKLMQDQANAKSIAAEALKRLEGN